MQGTFAHLMREKRVKPADLVRVVSSEYNVEALFF